MPENLFARACVLPGKSLAVFCILWQQSRMAGRPTVVLSTSCLGRFGLSRREKTTALKALAAAGLVSVRRRPRKNPEVTLTQGGGSASPTA
jgi:hypothetical protein